MKTRLYCKIGSAVAGAFLLMALAVLPARGQSFPTLIQAQGPVDYWRFNETTPSAPIDTVSNLGSVGAAGTGYVLNGALTGEPGIVGQSVRLFNIGQFIGQDTNMVDIPNVPALNPEPPFSIEFWTLPNGPIAPTDDPGADTTGMCILSSMSPDPNQSSRSGYLFYILSNSLTFRVGGEGGYAAIATANLTVPTNSWTHVVGEFDGTTASIYVNGKLMGTDVANNSFHINQWTPTRIGGTELDGDGYQFMGAYIFLFSGNRGYDGWVDEFAVYNMLLSSNTIASHYKAATTSPTTYDNLVKASSPVGYWNFDVPAFKEPTPTSFTLAANLGSLAEQGTNTYGTMADQPGVPGLSSDARSVKFSGEVGSMEIDATNFLPTFTGDGEQLTLAAWIKPGTLGVEYAADIIAQGFDNVLSETYLRMADSYDLEHTGQPDMTYYDVGSAGDVFSGAGHYFSAIYPVPPGDIGNWVFLAGTYDGMQWNLYRNGTLVATNADGGIGPNQVEAPWSVGSRAMPSPFYGFFFPGSISEAAIFTNALDASTILDLYNSVHRPPVITQALVAPVPAYLGSSADFNVWADGPGVLSYQWYSNSIALSGETQTNLALDGLTASDNATYAVVVSNAYGAVTSSVPLVVTPTLPPAILVPAVETRWIGSPLSFAPASLPNQQLSYQWFHDGSPISGATDSFYTAIATPDSPGTYTLALSNSFGVSNSSVATLSVLPVPAGYAGVILADAPLSYFRLDETGGTIAHDYAGGNDGTYNGGYGLGAEGALVQNPDAAVTFDGATNSFVGGIGPTAINFSGTSPEFSIEAWAIGAVGGVQNDAAIIAKGTGASGENFATEQFAIDVDSGVYRFYANDTQGNTSAAIAKSGPDGNWHHLVGVCDGSSGSLTLYVDGVQADSKIIPGAGILSSTDPVSIGAERSGILPDYDWAFAGTIDEVAIYAYALSADQVAAHYGSAFGTNTMPFVKTQPVSATNYVNLPVSFSVNAAGSMPLTYQWNKLTSPNAGPVLGETKQSFTIANLGFDNAGVYNCGITNLIGGIVTSNFTIVALAPPTNPPSIPGLVMHLAFDGDLTDSTGRGNDATSEASGGAALATNFTQGILGEAFTYSTSVSGTNVMANYASLGVRPDLQFGSGNFTVSFWIQTPPEYIGNDLPFFCDVVGSTLGHPGFSFSPSFGTAEGKTPEWAGGWAYSVFDTVDTGTAYYGDKDQINTPNTWYNLIYIVDHAKGVSVYVNGVLAHQNVPPGVGGGGSVLGVGNINSTNAATIGQDPTGQYPQDSQGVFSIDDLGVWNRAITPLEAASIFTAGNLSQLSFTSSVISTITLSATNLHNGSLELTWSAGNLQTATNLSGPWLTLTNVTSPLTTNTTSRAEFFRASQ